VTIDRSTDGMTKTADTSGNAHGGIGAAGDARSGGASTSTQQEVLQARAASSGDAQRQQENRSSSSSSSSSSTLRGDGFVVVNNDANGGTASTSAETVPRGAVLPANDGNITSGADAAASSAVAGASPSTHVSAGSGAKKRKGSPGVQLQQRPLSSSPERSGSSKKEETTPAPSSTATNIFDRGETSARASAAPGDANDNVIDGNFCPNARTVADAEARLLAAVQNTFNDVTDGWDPRYKACLLLKAGFLVKKSVEKLLDEDTQVATFHDVLVGGTEDVVGGLCAYLDGSSLVNFSATSKRVKGVVDDKFLLPICVERAVNDVPGHSISYTKKLCAILSRDNDPPIQQALDFPVAVRNSTVEEELGEEEEQTLTLLPRLMRALQRSNLRRDLAPLELATQLLLQILSIMASSGAGGNIESIVQAGAIPLLVRRLAQATEMLWQETSPRLESAHLINAGLVAKNLAIIAARLRSPPDIAVLQRDLIFAPRDREAPLLATMCVCWWRLTRIDEYQDCLASCMRLMCKLFEGEVLPDPQIIAATIPTLLYFFETQYDSARMRNAVAWACRMLAHICRGPAAVQHIQKLLFKGNDDEEEGLSVFYLSNFFDDLSNFFDNRALDGHAELNAGWLALVSCIVENGSEPQIQYLIEDSGLVTFLRDKVLNLGDSSKDNLISAIRIIGNIMVAVKDPQKAMLALESLETILLTGASTARPKWFTELAREAEIPERLLGVQQRFGKDEVGMRFHSLDLTGASTARPKWFAELAREAEIPDRQLAVQQRFGKDELSIHEKSRSIYATYFADSEE